MAVSAGEMRTILVTGATGYIGGRLVPDLLGRGYRVRAVSRSKAKLQNRKWANHPNAENVSVDVFDLDSLNAACEGCFAAYYLVHSMLIGQKDFQKADKTAAENMKKAAEKNSLKRIIYLGGLGEDNPALSKHLKSRAEVAKILSSGKIPATVFRAAMVIGSGSASFEILRYLVDRLPVMITPKWLETPSQPIAVRNVIEYLASCLDHEETASKTFDIGGTEILTYRELMNIYAEEAGLPKRVVIPVPVLTPRLSSYWIHLVTPAPASIARPLAEGLRNPVVCQNDDIKKFIPQEILTPREAVRRALRELKANTVPSHWTDAGKVPPVESIQAGDPDWTGGTMFKDQRSIEIQAAPEEVWKVVSGIGGKRGWYYANWLWVFRGFLDRCVGGVGLRRGRRDADEILPGDALDFWRVGAVEKEKQLLLSAEMKLPGKAVLEFRINKISGKACLLEQVATFYPKGLFGILYWYGALPLHSYIFQGMLRKIKELAVGGFNKKANLP